MTENKTYLGDGVYASYDGFHIVLRADDNIIYLEDYVLNALFEYIKRLKEEENDS